MKGYGYMKNIKYILALVLLLCSCLCTMADEAFYYPRYEVAVDVHTDNSFSVTERMGAFFFQQRHGIVRDMSTSAYVKRLVNDGEGGSVEKVMRYDIGIDNVKVNEQFECVYEDNYLGIRIGDANTLVTGRHDYVLSYDYRVGNDRTTTGDLFYFSLLGSDNDCKVDTFTFAIRFDRPVSKEYLSQIKLFFGTRGDEKNKAADGLTYVSDTLITGRILRLGPQQAVSIYLPLQEHYFSHVEPYDEGNGWNYAMTFVIVLLLLVAIRETKSRNNFTKVMQAWPPKGLSSADLGYIYDTSVDPQDKISLVPYMAHKGYLTIDVTSGHPVLHKKTDLPGNAPRAQRKLFDGFFGESDTFDTEKPTQRFAERWLDMDAAVKADNKGMGNDYALIHVLFLPILACIAGMIGMAFYNDVTNTGDVMAYVMGIIVTMGCIGVTSLFLWDATSESLVKRAFLILSWLGLIVIQVLIIANMLDDDCVLITPWMQQVLTVVYALMLGTSVCAFRLTSMSKPRLKYIGEILGLKDFIEKSEKPLLDSLAEEHERYFYDILPYAVAFGLADKWAKRFEGLNVAPPEWFQGNDTSLHHLMTMTSMNHLYSLPMSRKVNALQEARLAAESKSSASSYSSGGFSGGGFGGGGSHSW